MYTSQALRKSNIAEYILYMWQIEDLLRASNLDIDLIEQNIISRYANISDVQKAELKQWYEELIDMMRLEGVTKSGHLQINKNTLGKLVELHQELLKSPKFPEYGSEFYKTLPFIVELRSKAGENKEGEIETCLSALYGVLLLKLQGKELSPETAIAIKQISRFIATLSSYYHKNEIKPLFEPEKESAE